jgi:hypothetical protein
MVAVGLIGCGGGGDLVKVTGKIVDGGTPYVLEGEEVEEGGVGIEVVFYPLDGSGGFDKEGTAYFATAEPDGTFVLEGDEGDGIPAGKYRVALSQMTGSSPDAVDPFGDKFTADNSPLTVEVSSSNPAVELDISAAGGSGGS